MLRVCVERMGKTPRMENILCMKYLAVLVDMRVLVQGSVQCDRFSCNVVFVQTPIHSS
jgi:hypothetical protein